MRKITILRDNETLFSLTENSENSTSIAEIIRAYDRVDEMGILPCGTTHVNYILERKNQTEDKKISINKLIDIVISNFVKTDEVIQGHKVSFYNYMDYEYTIIMTR